MYYSVAFNTPQDWTLANKIRDMLVKQFPICQDAKLVVIPNSVAKEHGIWVCAGDAPDGPHFAIELNHLNQFRSTWESVMTCMSDWRRGYEQAQEEAAEASKVVAKPKKVKDEEFLDGYEHMYGNDATDLAVVMFQMLSPAKRAQVMSIVADKRF